MRIEAVIFDLDGTLLDTIDDIADTMNSVLAGLSLPQHSVEDYKMFVGAGTEVLIRHIIPRERLTKELMDEFGKIKVEDLKMERTHLYDGVPEMLDRLSKLGIRKAILSNRHEASVKRLVDRFLSTWNFDVVMGAVDHLPLKPDPAAALLLSKTLGVSPERCLFVGDSGIDMQTGSNAGMDTLGVLWGFRNAEELSSNGAKRMIKTPAEFLEMPL